MSLPPAYCIANNSSDFFPPIRLIDASGVITSPTLNPGSDPVFANNAGVEGAWGITVDPTGQYIYLADQNGSALAGGQGLVYRIDRNTYDIACIAGHNGGSGAMNFNFLGSGYDLCMHPSGCPVVVCPNLAIAINVTAITQTILGVSIAAGDADYVAGVTSYSMSYFLCFDSAGNGYTSDTTNDVIYKLDAVTGNASIICGALGVGTNTGDGGPSASATINQPAGLSLDNNGILYVASNDTLIRAINTSGTTQTGCGVSIAAGNIETVQTISGVDLSYPLWGLTADNQGGLFVCAVQRQLTPGVTTGCWVHWIDSSGTWNTVVSATGDYGNTGDGGAATSATVGGVYSLVLLPPFVPSSNASIIIQKVTSPPGDPAGFTIRPSWKALITLADGQSDTSTLSPGTYSVSEDHIPGWSTVITVSNGDPPGAIVLASSNITVTFTNSLAAPINTVAFVDPWVVNIDPLKLTVSDLDGSTDLANLVFNVQDRGQAITSDFPTFVFEGKPVMLLEGYVGMNVSDYLVRFTGLMNTVASDNGNNEYKFSVANYNLKKLTTKVYGLGDDGFTTSDNHPRTVSGHPLDILVSVLNQCAVLSSDIDLAKIHYYRDFIYNGREFLFNLTSAPTAKDFIESELMRPLGMYVWENNLGQVSINSFYPSIFPYGGYTPVLPPIATLDLTNTIEVPLAQEADLVNQVIFKFDANQGGNSDFAAESITDYDVSITKYGLVDGHTVESQGLRSAFQGYLMSNLIAFLIFLRYGLKNLFVDPVPCFWTLSTLEPGDIIAFNEPFVPDRQFGILGITGQTFEVMDRTWNFMTGVVELKLLAIDLSKFTQYLITPNGEGNWTAVSSAHKALYMYQSNAAGIYSDGNAGNTLG